MSVRQVANDEKEGATVMKHEHYMDMNRLSDWSVEQINELLDTCLLLKEMEEKGVRLPLLKDVVLAMMFDQQSTRTRVSFETAMTQLGGHAMFLDGSSLHAGSGQEDIAETAAIISSMADAIMIRSLSQRVIDEVVANSTVPVISGMSCALFQEDGFGSFTLWCTPVVQLVRRLTDPQGVVAEYVGYPVVSADVNPLENGGWQALGIYAAVAVAILALACLLCIRRRSELSGDVAAFPWMRPVLRYGVGCMGGLALGMILYSVTFGLARSNDIRAYLPGMLLCVVLMTLVCSFGMSMLLGKSLKIFRRTWKGTVLLAALLAAVCVCVRMDVAGVERRVPKTDEIESVTAQCRNIQPFTATSGDTETIEAIRAIHRAILEQVEDGDVDLDGTLIEDGQYIWIRLKYTLTDGSTLERGYNVPVRRASALYTAINQMMSTPLARQELAISGTADADSAPLGGSIYSVDTGDVRNLTAVEAQMLYQAAQQDVAEGRVISDILSDTGYSPLQVDITGNDWDCVLNLDNFTDDAHTLELVNRFLSGGDGESGE